MVRWVSEEDEIILQGEHESGGVASDEILRRSIYQGDKVDISGLLLKIVCLASSG